MGQTRGCACCTPGGGMLTASKHLLFSKIQFEKDRAGAKNGRACSRPSLHSTYLASTSVIFTNSGMPQPVHLMSFARSHPWPCDALLHALVAISSALCGYPASAPIAQYRGQGDQFTCYRPTTRSAYAGKAAVGADLEARCSVEPLYLRIWDTAVRKLLCEERSAEQRLKVAWPHVL